MASAAVLVPPGAPSSDATGREPGVLSAWATLVAHVLGRVYRSFLLTLLAAAIVPSVSSWAGFVVQSGSMEPSISVGDVVVAKPFSASEEVPLGRVVVFPNPARPGEGELLVHRVVERLDNGEFATAGDANPSYDAQTITSDDVEARAVLLVPLVGRPLVWLEDRDVAPLALWTALTALALYLASRGFGRKTGNDGSGSGRPRPGRRHRGLGRRRPVDVVPTLALLVAGGVAVSGGQLATAGFTDRTLSPANSWTVSETVAHRVSLASPGAVVRGGVPLTATLSNTGAGDGYTVRMQYATSGSSTWTTACTATATAPHTCSWGTSGLANRTYDLRAVATAGDTTLTSDVVANVLVDNLAPTVTMQDPGTPLRGTVTVAATAADAHSGVARVVIQYAASGSSTYRDLCTDSTSPYSCQLDTTTLANGGYSFRAVATDVAGGSTASAPVVNRMVDNVVTTVVMNDPGAVIRGTVTLSASASSNAGVASVRIQGSPAGAETWGDVCTDTSSPYSCAFNTATQPDGLYDLRAIVTDNAGRTTTSAVVASRRVDNTAPRAFDVQTTNGGVAGRVDTGDTMSLTFTEEMRLTSISPGWDGSAVAVTLRLRDGSLLGTGSTGDTVDILRSGSTVNLGSVNLRQDYISFFGTAQFNATMTATSVVVNGASATRVTITVGTQASGTVRTVTTASAMVWAPSGLATDLGGLGTVTSTATESGTSDRQF